MQVSAAQKKNINASMEALRSVEFGSQLYARGTQTATASEATAGAVLIDTGWTSATGFVVNIMRSGAVVTGDAAVGVASGILTVEDGASTYAVTEGDVIHYILL